MYDRLGDFLSEALDSGKIPESKSNENLKIENPQSFTSSEKMIFSLQTQTDINLFKTIGIELPCSFSEAKKAYKKKLNYYHPDKWEKNDVLKGIAKKKTEQIIDAWKKIESEYKPQ